MKVSVGYVLLLIGVLATYIYLAITLPVFRWDESRLAVNAYEALIHKDFINLTYLNEPEFWNTKPPFLIWLMSFSIYLNGLSELSIRLPSIIFSVLTIVFVNYILIKEQIIDAKFKILYGLILFCSIGFSGFHVAITADYEATLTFFTTVSVLAFYYWIENIYTNQIHARIYALLFFLCFTIALLTKGIVVLMFSPVFFLYFIFHLKRSFIFNRNFLIYVLLFVCSLALVYGYYYLRNINNPMYFQSVIENEIIGRYYTSKEGNAGNEYYYLNNLLNGRFSFFVFILPLFPILYFKSFGYGNEIRKFSIYLSLNIAFFFIIISKANTKLEWYDAPLYPLISIIITLIIIKIWNWRFLNYHLKWTIVLSFSIYSVFGLVSYYNKLINSIELPKERLSVNIKRHLTLFNPQKSLVLIEDYKPEFDFYRYMCAERGIILNRNFYENLPLDSRDTIVVSDVDVKFRLTFFYNTTILDSSSAGYTLVVNEFNSDKLKEYYWIKKNEIMNNIEWYNQIKEKAIHHQISIDNQIKNDISYMSKTADHMLNKEMRYYLVNSL